MLGKFQPDAAEDQRPFQEQGVPKANSGIVTTLLRLAMRRMPAHGFGATKSTIGVKPASAATGNYGTMLSAPSGAPKNLKI